MSSPTEKCVDDSEIPSVELKDQERRPLIVLEYFETMFSKNASGTFNGRSHSDQLIEYLNQHFDIVIWTRCRGLMSRIIAKRFPRALFTWGFDQLSFSHNQRIHYNDLEKIWRELPSYDSTNTIFLTHNKNPVKLQRHNTLAVSHYDSKTFCGDRALIKATHYLETLRHQLDFADYMRRHPFSERKKLRIVSDPALDSRQIKYNKFGGLLIKFSKEKKQLIKKKRWPSKLKLEKRLAKRQKKQEKDNQMAEKTRKS